MSMDIVASSRADFRAVEKVLRVVRPDDAQDGDMLFALLWSHGGETVDTAHLPAGWANPLGVPGALPNYKIYVFTHGAVGSDPNYFDFPLQAGGAVAHEWQGVVLAVRGGTPQIEQVAGQEFTATVNPPTTGVTAVEQATSLVVALYVTQSIDAVTGSLFNNTIWYQTDRIDNWSTAVLERETASIVSRRAGETGGLSFSPGSCFSAATGFQTTIVIRDGRPKSAPELYDVIPGNIGLLGVDGRAAAVSSGTAAGGDGTGTVGH
jgi:hypothetical protein